MKDFTVVHVLASFFYNKWIGAILKKICLVAMHVLIFGFVTWEKFQVLLNVQSNIKWFFKCKLCVNCSVMSL